MFVARGRQIVHKYCLFDKEIWVAIFMAGDVLDITIVPVGKSVLVGVLRKDTGYSLLRWRSRPARQTQRPL